ncbi:MAG: pentapeptide repeat-containing protein [Phycisphaerae bacterium]
MSSGLHIVPPRVFLPEQAEPVRIDRAVALYITGAKQRPIHILGPLGFGITTAIEFVRQSLALRSDLRSDVLLIDESARPRDWYGDAAGRTVIIGTVSQVRDPHTVTLRLAPWTHDDVVDYLLAVAPKQCGRVMKRVEPQLAQDEFAGYPALWTIALDEMLMDDSLPTPLAALENCISRYASGEERDKVSFHCFLWLCQTFITVATADELVWSGLASPIRRLLRCRPFQLIYAVQPAIRRLIDPGAYELGQERWPRDLTTRVGELAGCDSLTVTQVLHAMKRMHPDVQPIAASVLTATRLPWELPEGLVPRLDHADLRRLLWRDRNLTRVSAPCANFAGAKLWDVQFDLGDLLGANFGGAALEKCSLVDAVASNIDFTAARLSHCDFGRAELIGSNFASSTIERCQFVGSSMRRAAFDSAVVARSDFSDAIFDRPQLRDVRFTDCRFVGSWFEHARLRDCRFRHCVFDAAVFVGCDLQELEILEASFVSAELSECDLSGTHMPGANFHEAEFRDVGVMNASWPGADLSYSDLTGLMFHAGTSRSGLVGSPLASEGTRTGFYTDESLEQRFREPEQIRRADLRGCDLRGAKIEGVDFYLVDLRGAKLSDDQIPWLRQCRAILTPA